MQNKTASRKEKKSLCPAGGPDVNISLLLWVLCQNTGDRARVGNSRLTKSANALPSSHVPLKQMKQSGERMLAGEAWGWKACLDKMVPAPLAQ